MVERMGWIVHAFVLMGSHCHMLIEKPEGNLVDGMKWFQGAYTRRFNARYKISGHLFQGRYKALLVDYGECFFSAAAYIHLNPVRVKGYDFEQDYMEDYVWSS